MRSNALSGAKLDRLVFPVIEVAAVGAVIAAFILGEIPRPFPFGEYVLLILAAMALRRFGLPLPGKGFASFILMLPLYTVF